MKINEIYPLPQKEYEGGEEELSALSAAMIKRLVPLKGTEYDYGFSRTPKFLRIYIVNRGENQQVIAEMLLNGTSFPLANAYKVDTVTTHEQYRNQGLSKKLYEIALKVIKITLVAGGMQTPGGQRNWVSLANMPGVEIAGYFRIDPTSLDRSASDEVEQFVDAFFKQTPWLIGEKNNIEYYGIPLAYAQTGDKLKNAVKTQFFDLYNANKLYIYVGMYAHAT